MVVAELRELLLVHEQIAPALQRFVHTAQLANRSGVGFVKLQDLPEDRHQRAVALDVVAVHVGDLVQDNQTKFGILGTNGVELVAQNVYERSPCAGLSVQPLERAAGVGVASVLTQQALVLIDGLVNVLLGLRQLRDLRGQR